jgi:hypothetical protein
MLSWLLEKPCAEMISRYSLFHSSADTCDLVSMAFRHVPFVVFQKRMWRSAVPPAVSVSWSLNHQEHRANRAERKARHTSSGEEIGLPGTPGQRLDGRRMLAERVQPHCIVAPDVDEIVVAATVTR